MNTGDHEERAALRRIVADGRAREVAAALLGVKPDRYLLLALVEPFASFHPTGFGPLDDPDDDIDEESPRED